MAKDKLDEAMLSETGFWRTVYDVLFNSPPAWADEPTGFNLASPEDVFKDDVASGIAGYNRGTKLAAGTAAAAGAIAVPAVRNAAAKLAKAGVKTAAKNPVATTAAVVVAKEAAEHKDLIE